jgi:hypothetical protein
MPSSEPVFTTPLTKLFKINHPVMLAGSDFSFVQAPQAMTLIMHSCQQA